MRVIPAARAGGHRPPGAHPGDGGRRNTRAGARQPDRPGVPGAAPPSSLKAAARRAGSSSLFSFSPVLPAPLNQEAPRLRQLVLHADRAAAQRCRDFSDGPSLSLLEQQKRPVARQQALKRLQHLEVVQSNRLRGGGGERAAGVLRIPRLDGAVGALPVQTEVDRNPGQPGTERGVASKARQGAKDPEEGLLNRVLSVLDVTEDAVAEG